MDSVVISEIILNKRAVDVSDVSNLKELADKYPYAQLFTILYLKALSKNNSFLFESELNKYAYKVTDRVKLYEIIHSKEEVIPVQPIEDIEPIEDVIEEIPKSIEADTLIIEDSLNDEVVEVDIAIQKQKEEENSVEAQIQHIESPDEITILTNENKSVNPGFDEEESTIFELENTLEIDILTNAIDNAYPYILEKEIAKIEVKEDGDKPIEEEPEIKVKKSPQFNSFSGWLSQGKHENGATISIEVEEKVVVETKKETLIDKFIEKNPSISRPKKEFFSASKKAQESMDESSLIYSETLANIFVLQGNLPLALKAYEQLCLTIPEKKVIFAKKIEELNKRINNLK